MKGKAQAHAGGLLSPLYRLQGPCPSDFRRERAAPCKYDKICHGLVTVSARRNSADICCRSCAHVLIVVWYVLSVAATTPPAGVLGRQPRVELPYTSNMTS
jgi:hypothetical protein